MRRVVTWFVDALPFDMRSRRAIAETLADWAHEAREQHGVLQRIGVDILSAISVARVASLALVREAGDFDWTHGLARRARVVACIAVAIGVTFGLLTLSALGSWAWLAGFAMVPASLIALLPPAIILMIAWRPPNTLTVPSVGTASFVALATLCFACAVMPMSSVLMGIATTGGLREMAQAAGIDPNEVVSRPDYHYPALAVWVLGALSSAVLAAAGVLVAAAQRKRAALISAWWLVALPIAYLVGLRLVQFVIELTMFFSRVPSGRDVKELMSLRQAIAGSVAPVLILIGAVIYGHFAARSPNPPPATPQATD